MKYVWSKICLLVLMTTFVEGCGFLKERIFNNQPTVVFSNPTAQIFTSSATATFDWDTYDTNGQIRTTTQPYQLTLFKGANCTGTIVATASQLSTTYSYTSMTSGNKYSLYVTVVYDDNGNTAVGCSSNYHMDNQAPNAPVFTAPAASPSYNITGTYNFTWSAPADPGSSGISYYIINGYAMAGCGGGVVVGPSTQATLTYTWAGLADGTSYSIDVTPVDNAGNVGVATCTTPKYLFVDLTNPVVNCSNMTPGWYISSSMPLALSNSCTDIGGSGCNAGTLQCRYSADNGTTWGAWGSCSQTWADSTSGAGSKFQVRENDVAGGHQTTSGSCDIQVDKTAPPAPTLTSSPPALTNSTTWNFTYSSTDAASGTASYDCRIDSGAWSIGCGTNYNTGVLAGGAHTFDVRAIDTAGNTSALTTYSWTIDAVLPVCTVTQYGTFDGAATYWTNNSNPTVSFTCTDDSGSVVPGTFSCSIDGGAYGACSGISWVYPNGTFDMGGALGDGAHTVSVQVSDSAGNTGTSANMGFTIDTVAPVIGCNGQTAAAWMNAATGAQVYGDCTDAASGCIAGNLACSFDSGGTWISCTEAVAAIPEGNPVTYFVRSQDYAGNTNQNNACQYKLDRTPPATSATVASACGNSATNPILAGFDYDITPTVTETLSGLTSLTCNGAACVSGTPYTIAGGSLATVTSIPVVAADAAGNSTTYNLSVYIAGSQLTSTDVSPNVGWITTNPTLTTTLNVTDGNANDWTAGTTLQVNTDSVCVSPSWAADQWNAGPVTARQKLTGNYGVDGKRKTKAQLMDACGNSTAFTAYSATTDLDWQNPVTTMCNAVCNGLGNLIVTFNTNDPSAGCSNGDESGVAAVYIELDGGVLTSPAQAASGNYTFIAPGTGAHTVKCYAVDNAGNDNRFNDTNLTGTQFLTSGDVCP